MASWAFKSGATVALNRDSSDSMQGWGRREFNQDVTGSDASQERRNHRDLPRVGLQRLS
jgi:hypothetical protein